MVARAFPPSPPVLTFVSSRIGFDIPTLESVTVLSTHALVLSARIFFARKSPSYEQYALGETWAIDIWI